ncbi:hypothetical protein [Pseudomonas extremaustralis]|uniref:hypothetical protein n=1 Tax=Pseudomonas extremaustralis TaxID=359110 RepID=UPI002862B4B2|nr:hypothetical protein [Pseudomonas extremaustralis]MDR6580772.1 hypothetical protein [Pseudomonas extremaustralis]
MQPIQFFAARSEDGALLPGATVDVFVSGTQTRAALFLDSLGSVPLGNPFVADKNARVFFYTSSNRIDVQLHRGGYSAPVVRDIVVTDPDDILALTNGVYRTVPLGLAATANGKIFQVVAPEGEAAYAIYVNDNGTALDTGKRIPTRYLLDKVESASRQYADDAKNYAENAKEYAGRNFGPLASDPVTNPLGQPLVAGDRYFNISDGIERVYTGFAWYTPNADGQAIQLALANPNDPVKGAGMVALPYGNVRQAIKYLTPEMFGALGNDVADDTEMIMAAHAAAKLTGAALHFAYGRIYRMTGFVDVSNVDVHWIGGGTIHLIDTARSIEFHSESHITTLMTDMQKATNWIKLKDVSLIKPGSIIYLQTNMDSGSPYGGIGTRQAFTVAGKMASTLEPNIIDSNVVNTLERSEWTFKVSDDGLTVVIYPQPRLIDISGIRFIRDQITNNRAVSVTGCRVQMDYVSFVNTAAPDPDSGQDGILITRCTNGHIRNFKGSNLRYAINLGDGASGMYIENPYGERCRHVTYLNGWVVNTRIKNLRGENNNALMDSHASLNTTYDGVFTSSDRGFSNCRGDGATLRNIDIATTAETTGDGFRAAQIRWNDAYAEQRNSRDTILENVKITYPPTWNDHFQVGYAKNVILKNVNTYPASIAVLSGAVGDVAEVRMEDCNLNLALGSGSIVRAPIYSKGRNNRGSKIQAVTSDEVVYSLYPYPDGVVNGIDLAFSGSVFRDSVSVATRSFSLALYPHTRPLNYFNLSHIEGVVRLRIAGSNFAITDYTLPFKFSFTGGTLGGSIGTLVGTSLVAAIIPMEVGSIVSVTTDGLWSLKIPFTIIRQNTGQLFSVSYSVEAIGGLI